MTDEQSQELFEANLPLGGILPLRTELVFESGVPVELKKARFHVRDGQGHEWKMLSSKATVGRILKANEIYAYNPNSRKQFERIHRLRSRPQDPIIERRWATAGILIL